MNDVAGTAIFGAFVSILDSTVVNTALPHIQRAFGTDLHVASYVITAYTLLAKEGCYDNKPETLYIYSVSYI